MKEATQKDIEEAQRQLADTYNDPSMFFTCWSFSFCLQCNCSAGECKCKNQPWNWPLKEQSDWLRDYSNVNVNI